MFNTKGQKSESSFKTGKFINVGPNYVKITKLTKQVSERTQKFRVIAHFETEPIQEEGWEGQDGALGKVGKVPIGIWTSGNDKPMQDVLAKFMTIAEAFGVREQLDEIKSDNIDDYLSKVESIFKNKFRWWLIGGEEYLYTKDGVEKIGISLAFLSYLKIADSEEALLAKMKDKVWPTKSDSRFFKALKEMDSDAAVKSIKEDTENQLPF